MSILKFTLVILMLSTGVNAQGKLPGETKENHEEEMSLALCRSLDHRFNFHTNACVYCAHRLYYDPTTSQCSGTPDVLGKCYGEDHYHAKTQECMYCAKGYLFNEDLRACMLVNTDETKK